MIATVRAGRILERMRTLHTRGGPRGSRTRKHTHPGCARRQIRIDPACGSALCGAHPSMMLGASAQQTGRDPGLERGSSPRALPNLRGQRPWPGSCAFRKGGPCAVSCPGRQQVGCPGGAGVVRRSSRTESHATSMRRMLLLRGRVWVVARPPHDRHRMTSRYVRACSIKRACT